MTTLLFQIAIFHAWFKNGMLENVHLNADAETAQLIKRYRLMARMEHGVFYLFSSFQSDTAALLRILEVQLEERPLRFLVNFSPSQFVSITDVPLDWIGKVYFSSKNNEENIEKNTITLLAEYSKKELAAVRPGYIADGSCADQVIGEILIYPANLLSAAGKKIAYEIFFNARVLHWLYYLVNQSQKNLYNPTIIGEGGLIFNPPQAVVLPNGQNALSFSSGNLQFSLQQFPTIYFNLIDRLPDPLRAHQQTVDRLLMKGLPTPELGQIATKSVAGKQYVFTEMYIYL